MSFEKFSKFLMHVRQLLKTKPTLSNIRRHIFRHILPDKTSSLPFFASKKDGMKIMNYESKSVKKKKN
jgi:hypothetical protein